MYHVHVSICAFFEGKVKENMKHFLRKDLTSFFMLLHTFDFPLRTC